MTRLVVNHVADRDVDKIFEIAQSIGGSANRDCLRSGPDALYVRPIQFPESGAPRPKLGAGIRLGVVRPFVILHRYDRASDVVEILRVVDGRRDIGPSFVLP